MIVCVYLELKGWHSLEVNERTDQYCVFCFCFKIMGAVIFNWAPYFHIILLYRIAINEQN